MTQPGGSGVSRPAPRRFERVLGRYDLVLFTVCAILTLDTLASAASMGVAWFSWWLITMVVFFVPYGLITAELGSAWPGEGGVFIWVREAYGPRWGSLAAWLYWINNAYWIPSVYLVFAGTFERIFLGRSSTWQEAGIAIVLTWLTVGLGIVRLEVSKWVPNVGAAVKVLIFMALGALGIGSLLSGRPAANDFSARSFLPKWNDTLAYLPVLLYNTFGFELMSSAGEEMRDPRRDVPRVIVISGAVIAVVYAMGVGGILLAVPLEKLSIVTGTWDALEVLGRQWGRTGDAAVRLLGLAFLYACVANVVTWSLGANRVAAAAAEAGVLPASLGRLHPRFRTPHLAFVATGVVATVLLVGNALLSSSQSNIFWMTFKLSGVCLLLCYLLVFPAFLALRRKRPGVARPYRVPGGPSFGFVSAASCTLFVAAAAVLFFAPSPTSQDPVREAVILGVETLVTVAAGWLLIPRSRRSGPV